MKKNLLSILILTLLIINIALTSIMMFGMMSSVKSTSALVGKIAAVLNLELTTEEKEEQQVSIADSVSYDISEAMTIPLKNSENDEEQHYAKISVSILMDKNSKDFKKYSDLSAYVPEIKSIIIDVVMNYTKEEFMATKDDICKEILSRIQERFDNSDVIYNIVSSDFQVY